MNGIDKITQRIGADTQAEIDRILADAAAQAEAAADKFRISWPLTKFVKV